MPRSPANGASRGILPISRWAALVYACVCVCLGAFAPAAADPAAGPAAGAPLSPSPPPPRFGIDSAKAYAHAGLEAVFSGGTASGANDRRMREDAYMAIQGLVQAHAFRLVGRLGLASSYPTPRVRFGNGSAGGSAGNSRYRLDLGEASLGLRLGAPDADEGFRIGVMPMQGNPDAILYGNYLARYHPFPTGEARGLKAWDSLGALAPRVAGMRLALGRNGGPLRAEGWLARDEGDYSWFAFLSGRAPRKIDWGLGVSGYREFTSQGDLVSTPGKDAPLGDSPYAGGFIAVDSLPPAADTVYYTYSAVLYSARVSLDIVSLLGVRAPADRYGGFFAEAALLGWKNQPIYYSDRWDRILWTVGTRIPAFGWLDVCVAQVEWRRPSDYVYYGWGLGSWIPPDVPRPRRPSPWAGALLLAKRMGKHAEAQARASASQEGPARGYGLLGRIVFRF
jgi:hypothetical protein